MKICRFKNKTGDVRVGLAADDGTLLATATFTGETAWGWQSVNFANPVPVTAGTTYVAGYYAPNGHYAQDIWGMYDSITSGPQWRWWSDRP